ncbi:MAG: response regulator [Pirellulales bacterium]|nr:response regulator [Pirellulales bacterium]
MFHEIPKILLVEEEQVLAEITQFRLELLGYKVVHFTSAEDALAWLQNELPNLIIIDQVLPGMAGTDLINRLSNDEKIGEIPVILLSSNADLDEVQKAYNAGADEYLVAPYDPAVLERKIDFLLTA